MKESKFLACDEYTIADMAVSSVDIAPAWLKSKCASAQSDCMCSFSPPSSRSKRRVMKCRRPFSSSSRHSLIVMPAAFAQSPVGTWRTIDDETGKPKSHVEIYEQNGKLYGKITKLLNPSEPNPTCKKCSGAKKGTSATQCRACNGSGQVRVQQGFFVMSQTCPTCHGRGKVIPDPCKSCHGEGRVRKQKTLEVKIPAGVDTGDRIRLTGEGEAGTHGGPAGDLYVQVVVRDHRIFKRDGADLYCEVPIDFADAALGGELEVPTLDGRVKLRIPEGTQSGKLFRLKGKGVKPIRSHAPGDMLCRVVVETPVNLTPRQKELLQELRTSMNGEDGKQSPQKDSFFSAVRKFFDEMTK